jgi:dipeptidyl aminopeptidase/acylaminoacyl peptidase
MATRSRRLSAEDLWRLARPAQPTLSPDGAQACVSVSTFDMEENKGRTKLWLLSTYGGEPRPLTEAGEKDGEPRWSPDGARIAFVAKRDGDDEPQLWLIAPDGGEARRITRMPTGVSGIKWFPDSRRVAFISWVWPGAIGYKALEARYKESKEAKVKAHVVEHEAYRWWDHWLSDGRVPRLFVVDVQSQRITDLFANTPYELPAADPAAHHYDISPDGREIAFTFDPAEEKRFDHEYHVAALDLRARQFRTLTKGSRLSHGSPSYSPATSAAARSPNRASRSSIGRAGGSRHFPRAGTAAWTRRSPGRRAPTRWCSWPRTARATTPSAGGWASGYRKSPPWAAPSRISPWPRARSRSCATT